MSAQKTEHYLIHVTNCERRDYVDREDLSNRTHIFFNAQVTVAAYIETLQRQAALPTVKQHMAAIGMLFSWLTEKGILAMNPAREVQDREVFTERGCGWRVISAICVIA